MNLRVTSKAGNFLACRATIALKGSVPWKERSDFEMGKNFSTLKKS
jgi:hypothetical protein